MIILNGVSQTEKDKYHMLSLICGLYNMIQMNLFPKQKQTEGQRTDLKLLKGESWGRGDNWGVWDEQVQTTVCKLDKQQGFSVLHRGTVFSIL